MSTRGLWAGFTLAHPGPWALYPPYLDAMRTALVGSDDGTSIDGPADEGPVNYDVLPGGIARLPIRDVILNRTSMIGELAIILLGGTLLSRLRDDLNAIRADSAVRGVLLEIDSPGGELSGLYETARQIRELDSVKPVGAFIAGLGASAAYWLASAARWVIGDPASMTGSIGVVGTLTDDTGLLNSMGIERYQVVSTQSPLKVPDWRTERGRAQIQEWVDSAADLFLNEVAAFRGVAPLRVQEDFGQGDVLAAPDAFKVGLIDKIGRERDAIGLLQEQISANSRVIGQPHGAATAGIRRPMRAAPMGGQ